MSNQIARKPHESPNFLGETNTKQSDILSVFKEFGVVHGRLGKSRFERAMLWGATSSHGKKSERRSHDAMSCIWPPSQHEQLLRQLLRPKLQQPNPTRSECDAAFSPDLKSTWP
jgi:hypothetical protein